MGMVMALIIIGAIAGALLLAVEPPSPQQRATHVRREIELEKELGMAEIDAATESYKRQVFDLVAQANRRMVEEQAEQARQSAQQIVAQAAKEN